VELDAAERLRQALLDHGFYEAAALVEADIEAQEAEEFEELEDEEPIRANLAGHPQAA
jgi:hypothetical protein